MSSGVVWTFLSLCCVFTAGISIVVMVLTAWKLIQRRDRKKSEKAKQEEFGDAVVNGNFVRADDLLRQYEFVTADTPPGLLARVVVNPDAAQFLIDRGASLRWQRPLSDEIYLSQEDRSTTQAARFKLLTEFAGNAPEDANWLRNGFSLLHEAVATGFPPAVETMAAAYAAQGMDMDVSVPILDLGSSLEDTEWYLERTPLEVARCQIRQKQTGQIYQQDKSVLASRIRGLGEMGGFTEAELGTPDEALVEIYTRRVAAIIGST